LLPNKPNVIGYVLGLDGLGAVIAGTILSRRGDIKHYGRYFVLGFFLLGIGTLGIALYQITWPLFFFYISPFILGIGSGINMIIYGYIIKKESLEHQVGCVYGINSALQNAALAVGTILGGFLVIWFGTREVYVGLAIMMLVLAVAAISLLRTPPDYLN